MGTSRGRTVVAIAVCLLWLSCCESSIKLGDQSRRSPIRAARRVVRPGCFPLQARHRERIPARPAAYSMARVTPARHARPARTPMTSALARINGDCFVALRAPRNDEFVIARVDAGRRRCEPACREALCRRHDCDLTPATTSRPVKELKSFFTDLTGGEKHAAHFDNGSPAGGGRCWCTWRRSIVSFRRGPRQAASAFEDPLQY